MLVASNNRVSGEIKEVFVCSCQSINKTCMLHYFVPQKDEDEEDDQVYFSLLTESWRTSVLPPAFSLKDLFKKDEREWTPLAKEYWSDFYRGSVWKRTSLALKYFFTNNTKETLLNVIVLDKEDCVRFLDALRKYIYERDVKEDIEELVIHSEEAKVSLRLSLDIIERGKEETEDTPDILLGLSFEPIFKPKNGFKKLFYTLKYIFNYKCNAQEEHFIFDRKIAPKVDALLRKVIECPSQK
tara:strand:- start:785 stop:1507 length:723 start_codon:yes stop_codon:yes gene_type:complete